MTTIVDTDVLIGLVDEKDALHQRSVAAVEELTSRQALVFLLPTTISEFATLATIKIGFARAKEMTNFILLQGYRLVEVSERITNDANTLYQKQQSKENSLFDCFTMTAAQNLSIDCILSFDKGYRQNGFLIVEDYLRQVKVKEAQLYEEPGEQQ
jgi:predicted nucleic acid-binding protein